MNGGEPGGHDMLDRNLRALLRHSWRPIRMRPELRAELRERILDGFALAAVRSDAPARRYASTPILAMAAALLIATAMLPFAIRQRGTTLRPEQLVARGEVAVRSTPAERWRPADGDHSVLLDGGLLEVLTPQQRGHRIDLPRAGSIDVAAASRVDVVALRSGPADPYVVWLRDGAATLDHPPGATPIELRTDHGVVRLRDGLLAAARQDGTTDSQPGEGSIALLLHRGAAHLIDAAGGVDTELPPTRVMLLSHGQLLGGSDVADAGPLAGRRPADQDLTDPPLAPADATRTIAGRVTTSTGAAPDAFEAHLVMLRRDGDEAAAFEEPPQILHIRGADAFVFADLVPGDYRVHVRSDGLAPWHSDPIAITAKPLAPLEVHLEAARSVRGTVRDASTGNPLAGALVFSESDAPSIAVPLHLATLRNWSGLPPGCTFTDALGRFELAIGSGEQVVRASADGRVASWQRVTAVRATTLDFALDQTDGGFRGRITGADGAPAPGEIVVAWSQEPIGEVGARAIASARTDRDGHYDLPDLPDGLYVVLLAARDGGAAPQLRPARVVSWQRTQVDFIDPRGAIQASGRLLDASGAPLAGVILSFAHEQPDAVADDPGWRQVVTDADGAFVLPDAEPGSYDVFRIVDAGKAVDFIARVATDQGLPWVLTLPSSGGSVAGTIIDALDAHPIENATVVLSTTDDRFVGKRLTSATGAYAFADVAPGLYVVGVVAAGSHAGRRSDPLHVGEAPTHCSLALDPGGDLLLWVHAADGSPIDRADIALTDAAGGAVKLDIAPRTRADGSLRLSGLPTGRLHLVVSKPHYATATSQCVISAGDTTTCRVSLNLDPP